MISITVTTENARIVITELVSTPVTQVDVVSSKSGESFTGRYKGLDVSMCLVFIGVIISKDVTPINCYKDARDFHDKLELPESFGLLDIASKLQAEKKEVESLAKMYDNSKNQKNQKNQKEPKVTRLNDWKQKT